MALDYSDKLNDYNNLIVLRMALRAKIDKLPGTCLSRINSPVYFVKKKSSHVTYPVDLPFIIRVFIKAHYKNKESKDCSMLLSPYMTFENVKPIIKEKFDIDLCSQIFVTTKGIMHAQSYLWEGNIRSDGASFRVCEYSFINFSERIHNNLSLLYDQVRHNGWKCPDCTFINRLVRPGCEVCSRARPSAYRDPDQWDLSPEDAKWLEEINLKLERAKAEEQKKIKNNYENVYKLANEPVIANSAQFECPVCLTIYDAGEGICLRNCLHVICKMCLIQCVKTTETPALKCPYFDDEYSCDQLISHSEIKHICDKKTVEFLEKLSLRTAELSSKSFHCLTPDCAGFCFFDMVGESDNFTCEICGVSNCINCRAQHADKTCKEYQDDLKRLAINDENVRKTMNALNEMLKNGNAMHCPNCKIIITKREGCDNIICSMCGTEICWCTKGYRRGPLGCRCGENGRRCHPNCKNCH